MNRATPSHKIFTRRAFKLGGAIGFLAALTFAILNDHFFGWKDAIPVFYVIAFFVGGAFTVPAMLALMVKTDYGLDKGDRSAEQLEKLVSFITKPENEERFKRLLAKVEQFIDDQSAPIPVKKHNHQKLEAARLEEQDKT